MKKTYCFILFFIIKIITGHNDSPKIYKNQIKFSPARFVGFVRGLQLNYERQISSDFSIQVQATYIFDPFAASKFSTWKQMNGFSFALQPKYFIYTSGSSRDYISADLTFLSCNFDYTSAFGYRDPIDSLQRAYQYDDTVTVHRTIYTFNLRYGIQAFFKCFVLDFNVGLGIRYRDVTHSGRLNPNDEMEGTRHPNIENTLTQPGHYFFINLPVSLTIGYRF